MNDFLLLITEGCHLCEEAELMLRQYPQPISFQKVDIIDHPDFHVAYALHIPVLYDPATSKALNWPFEEKKLAHFIASH